MSNNTNNISTPKQTKGYKFNFIDVILVLLCLAIIGGCVYVFSPKFNFDLFRRIFYIHICFEFISKTMSANWRIGSHIFFLYLFEIYFQGTK